MDAPNARHIAETIGDDIVSGRLQPGAQLPSERELAARFGVGRPLLREALRSLGELGLIETRPGRGTFVRAVRDAAIHRQVGIAIRRRGVTAAQLTEARIMLETEAAGLAAERATPDDIERLKDILDRFDASESLDHVRLDLAFHLAVVSAAHNPVIEMMLESIAPLMVALMTCSIGDVDAQERSRRYHRAALDAIAAGTPDAARDAVVAHLSVAGELHGEDFDLRVDSLTRRAMRQRGSVTSLEDVVSSVLSERDAGWSAPGMPGTATS